jgi:hypothetical protein
MRSDFTDDVEFILSLFYRHTFEFYGWCGNARVRGGDEETAAITEHRQQKVSDKQRYHHIVLP